MQQKYVRLFLVETHYRVRMLTAAILIVVIFLSHLLVGVSKKALERVKKEKELVLNIPIMEKLIASRTQAAPDRPAEVVAPDVPINLEGTYVKNGVTYALINGSIVAVGDTYGEYLIEKVEFGTAVLRNRKTNEEKILQFFYYEE